MASIDDTDHGEQEDEWETVWELPAHVQAFQAANDAVQHFAAKQSYLENVARIAAGPQIESPALLALQRMDQLAAGMLAWQEDQWRAEAQSMRAQGYVPKRRRKQRVETPIDRQVPERSSMPRHECAPPVTATDSDACRVMEDRTSEKRGRGNHSIRPYLEQEEFDMYMREYVSTMQRLPSQPAFIRYLDKEKHMVLIRRTLGRYAINYHETDWRGCVALFAHLIRQE